MRLKASGGGDDEVNAAINTTPLVDVMLVLLIIFLITIPVVTKTVPLNLPKQSNVARQTKPENIEVSVDRDGGVYWNGDHLTSRDELLQRLKVVAQQTPQPVVQIRGDGQGAYEGVGRVLLACQRAAIAKIGFITEPAPKG
ncbi:ExbD/TolR family protein [Roseateles sp.]|uniref:ExbD/TolR family protein n=1 Tax=Roseateles sp. TaxID=1971397 RepID=UPI0039EAA57A